MTLLPIRIYYEDTDAQGIVYHASYLRFYDRGRSEWLRNYQIDQSYLSQQGVIFVLSDIALRFRRPLYLDQQVNVVTKLDSMDGCRLQFAQEITVLGDDKGTKAVNSATVNVVTVDAKSLRPCRLPEALAGRLHNLI